MKEIEIQEFQQCQEFEVYQLIKTIYDEFVSIDYTNEGNDVFYDWINPSKISDRQREQTNLLIAIFDSKIVGMIEIRQNNHISLMFVDKKYQRQGIAKDLLAESIRVSKNRDSTIDKYFVNSSPFAVSIYSRLGFVATDVLQEQSGIKFVPMIMQI